MTIFPALRYENAPAAIEWLQDGLGFEVVADYRSESDPDRVDHAELRWPEGGGVMLGSGREDSSLKNLPTGTGSVYLVTERPDEIYARVRETGARIEMELHDTSYGSRGFTCRDPEGVYWSLGTYAGADAG